MDRVFIIAELGINHNGDINTAKRLIDMAKTAGCDAVKFQKRTIDLVYTKEFLDSPRESPWGNTQRAQKEGLEFGFEEYQQIDSYCSEIGIEWFASAWDIQSLEFLGHYDLKYNKIASAMLTHREFLERVTSMKKTTFISTGMGTYEDIDRAIKIFREKECPFVLMHTVSTYPCKNEECNILMIKTLKQRYDCEVGYSGHEVGVLPTVLAVAMGATVIERHITLDRAMYGSDQSASLERRGLEIICRNCREVKDIYGTGEKVFSEAERIIAKKLRYFEDNV